jgi:predicted O-methyltransferase YrrM
MSDLIQQIESLTRDLYPIRPETVDDEKVARLLRLGRELLVAPASALTGASNPDWEVAANWRKPARQVARGLLASAAWLSDETRRSLEAFLDAFQAIESLGRYEFTADWFSRKCEAQWQQDLAALAGRPRLSFLEVGCYEGRATVWLLDHILTHASSRIVCIDPFCSAYVNRFERNIRASGAARKVRQVQAYSAEGLRRLRTRRFDFAYIDGDHRKEFVLEDAVLAWPCVKVGGLVTFDDYSSSGVRVALDAFLSIYGAQSQIVHEGAQLTIRRTATMGPHISPLYGRP